jgi:succinyl-CoA synthetase beta subunit|tara:strand:- start:450 stop:632 length:183 start_codon:yes stop_codon:yes gene_type:complete
MTKKTYHIYLNDKCLFKNLNEEEFDIIWNKLYTSYWREEITYTEVNDLSLEDSTIYEHSY